LILDEVTASVAAQLDDQAKLGVRIVNQGDVPETGPVHGGVWVQVPEATAVFVDLKGSTGLNSRFGAETAAHAYNYFNRAMAVIMNGFQARYVDVQGDGLFGLFSGKGSRFMAAACAITMKSQVETVIAERFRGDVSIDWQLRAGIGVDRGKLVVRQFGLRGTGINEVWAGTPVNAAAKLSGVAGPNEVAVSEKVFADYQQSAKIRQRALLWSCGCEGNARGGGLDLPAGRSEYLWQSIALTGNLGLDFDHAYHLRRSWCQVHGAEFCEALVTRQRRKG